MVLLLRKGKERREESGRGEGEGLSSPRKKFLAPPLLTICAESDTAASCRPYDS